MDARRRAAVRETYERIGHHFAQTREYAWPEVEAFVAEVTVPEDALALDLGCGNGRHSETLAERAETVVGVDASRRLLEAARDRAADREFAGRFRAVQGDAARLPLRSDSVDVAVYVATLHHLPTRADRLASLDELARVLAPDGRALVSVWSTAHDRFDVPADAETGFDTTVEWTLPGGETVDRFYHVYAPAEFAADIDASDLELVEWDVSSGNCYGTVGSGEGETS